MASSFSLNVAVKAPFRGIGDKEHDKMCSALGKSIVSLNFDQNYKK